MTQQTFEPDTTTDVPGGRVVTSNSRVTKPQETLTRDDKRGLVKQIKTQNTTVMNPVEYEQMKILARDFIESDSVPGCFSNASQVLMALQSGKEMGMTPVESLQSLYIVNGALNIWGKAVPRRLRIHGYMMNYSDESPETCTVTVTNKDGSELYQETLTFGEAQSSGYTTDSSGRLKIGWKLGVNRKLKLRYGVLAILIKTYIPEVLGSVDSVVEVAQDFDPDEQPKPDNKSIISGALAEIEDTHATAITQEQDDD